MIEAAKQNQKALQYAAEELCMDREIMLEAAKQNEQALQYAAKELRMDPEFMLKVEELRQMFPVVQLEHDGIACRQSGPSLW